MTADPQTASGTGVDELAALIRASERTVALTGAGISVPSGIPDFRTPGKGLWAKVDPMSVATIDAFHRDTKRFWDFYRPRVQLLREKRPNPAHETLAELERRGRLEAVITQNIDRLHRMAGSQRVVEVHPLDDQAAKAKIAALTEYRTQLPALEAEFSLRSRPEALRYEIVWEL